MAYRVRFFMDMNAREAMHVIELRTAPQGHPAYRRVCQRMHTLIASVAGHRAIAGAMQFADHSRGRARAAAGGAAAREKRERLGRTGSDAGIAHRAMRRRSASAIAIRSGT